MTPTPASLSKLFGRSKSVAVPGFGPAIDRGRTGPRVPPRFVPRSTAGGLTNVVQFTGPSIDEVLDIDAIVAIATFTGFGVGDPDDGANMDAYLAGGDLVTVVPGFGNPIPFVGGTGYVVNASQIIGRADGSSIGAATLHCGLSLTTPPSGTYSFGVVVTW